MHTLLGKPHFECRESGDVQNLEPAPLANECSKGRVGEARKAGGVGKWHAISNSKRDRSWRAGDCGV